MNDQEEIKEVLIESISKSFLLPIKEILKVDKIPVSIWKDEFISGFLLTQLTELAHIIQLDTGYKVNNEEFENILYKIDPDNAKFIIDLISGEQKYEFDENKVKRGEEIAKKHLFLGYRKKYSFIPLHYEEDDEDIVFAFKKANTYKEIMSAAYPGSPIVENMTGDDAASQALIYYKIFDYIKDNKHKFTTSKYFKDDDKLTLREIYKYGKKNFSQDLKKGIDKVLDADLKKINKKNIEGFFFQGGDKTLIKFTLIICVLFIFLGIMHGI